MEIYYYYYSDSMKASAQRADTLKLILRSNFFRGFVIYLKNIQKTRNPYENPMKTPGKPRVIPGQTPGKPRWGEGVDQ